MEIRIGMQTENFHSNRIFYPLNNFIVSSENQTIVKEVRTT